MKVANRWSAYFQSQHYFLLIFIQIQMGVWDIGKHSDGAVHRIKELLLHIFLIVAIIFTMFANHIKKHYFLCTAPSQNKQNNPEKIPKPPKNSKQSSYPSCCMTSVHVHGLPWILLCALLEGRTQGVMEDSVHPGKVYKGKQTLSSCKKTGTTKKIPARFPIDSFPLADHSKNQSITVNR